MHNEVIWTSSEKSDWATPQDFFNALDAEFHFTLDPCASPENAKCERFYTPAEDGLIQDWAGETCFVNPPYGRRDTRMWVRKCCEEAQKPGTTVVMLIPARTDTQWFHDLLYGKPGVEIRFVRGRLHFGGSADPAPFPSMVVVMRSPEMKGREA